MIFFTADNHFGHSNILEYCNRPFSSVEEMDEEMIRRWNEKVGPRDAVYHLGDITLGTEVDKYLRKLNGRIKILGNAGHHDKRWLARYIRGDSYGAVSVLSADGWRIEIVPPIIVLESEKYKQGEYPQVIVLCHYPIAQWDRRHYGSWHLYGHSHGTFDNGGLSMDVGVDANDFYPVSLEEVAEVMRSKE